MRRGACRSTAELDASIEAYVPTTNADPRPFRWTKPADDILVAVQRFRTRTVAADEASA